MASSSPPPADPHPPGDGHGAEPAETHLDTIGAQIAAIDRLLDLAQQHVQVFDIDLSQGGWNAPARIESLMRFLRGATHPRLDIIVHDTRWIESSAARLCALLRTYGHAVTIYTTGAEARSAMDPLVIVDGRHMLHRFHISQPRASLVIEQPHAVKPWMTRFEEIWATGEPGIAGTVLGL